MSEKKKMTKALTNGTEIVREVMEKQGVTMVCLAESAGFGSKQNMYQCLKNDSLNLSSFFKIMSAMKYRIVVEPDVGSLKQNQYLVTGCLLYTSPSPRDLC